MRFSTLTKTVLTMTVVMMPTSASAGPTAYGTCQTGCNNLAVACYKAAGSTFGTVVATAATPEILACNTDLGTCAASCAAKMCESGITQADASGVLECAA